MLKIHPFRIAMLSKRDLHPLQAAANLSGEQMLDMATMSKHEVPKRNSIVVYSNLILPNKDSTHGKNLPDFLNLRKGARSELVRNAKNTLWLRVDWTEKRDDAQFGRLFTLTLPPTLSLQLAEKALESFAEQELVERGMVVDVAIHEVRRNDVAIKRNAYAMATTRPFVEGDFQNKDRSWNDHALLYTWRKNWFSLLQSALLEDQKQSADPTKHQEWLSLCVDYMGKNASDASQSAPKPFQDPIEEEDTPVAPRVSKPRL